jgi:hypothetical protein
MSLYLDHVPIVDYGNSFILIKDNKPFCYDENKNFIINSNDSCYLFNGICNPPKITTDPIFFDLKVIPFLTHFHTGVHAYSGVYSILYWFIKNNYNQQNYKIVVYENIQEGILEVLYELFNKDDIFLLKPDTLYRFSEIRLIPNSLHSFFENYEMTYNISNIILTEKIKDNITNYPKKIAILKTSDESITSTNGVIDYNLAEKYCEDNGYVLLKPKILGEIKLINYINNCEEILFSWGTTLIKNFIYLSDNAKIAKVWVVGKEFNYEYQNAMERNIICNKYKNCTFEYIINPKI